MVITYEVTLNGNSIGEVTEWTCAPFSSNPYTMWKATSFIPGIAGGQFNAAEKAEEHLLTQARDRKLFLDREPIVWPEFTDEEAENIPF
jgi:hypothetical protein